MNFALFQGRRRGFTLIEIMVALVIFTVLMTSLFASFRTGMKAFTMSTEHADQQQLGRFAINQVAKDLHNVFYKPESQYNVARRQQEAMLDEQLANTRSRSGRPDIVDQGLPELGPPIDLSFTAEDGGEVDQLSLVRRVPFSIDNPTSMWGLARITYYVIDDVLYRATDDITKPETDEEGNMIPKATRPQVEKLADNCIGFDLKFGYYFEDQWHLADSWDSSASEYRNPATEEDGDILNTVGENASGAVQSQGTAAVMNRTMQQQQQQQRADDLPGWVELTFKFVPDKKKPDQYRTYKQTIVINHKYANETYVPQDEQDDLKGARANSRSRRNNRNMDRVSESAQSSGRSQ